MFGDRLYGTGSELIYEDAQEISDANGAPVALLERDGWQAICEEPPDDMESAPLEHGWTEIALIEPTETETERITDHGAFTDDEANRQHARKWAANEYGDDHADLFVAFLLTLSDYEQDRISEVGYTYVRGDFEAAYPDVR